MKEKDTTKGSISGSASLEGAVSVTGVRGHAKAAGKSDGSLGSETVVTTETIKHTWHRLGGEIIKVGPTNGPLDGPLISDFAGWRVIPNDTNEESSVVASVNVRENWINFDNIEVTKMPSSLVNKITSILFSPKKRRYFELLLKHLATMDLGGYQNGKGATIAAHVLRIRPSMESVTSLPSPKPRAELAIDGRLVKEYVENEEFAAAALVGLGIDQQMVREVSGDAGNSRKTSRGKDFIPDSSPVHAAESFSIISSKQQISVVDLPFPNTTHDLKALGLVEVEGGEVSLSDTRRTVNPEATMRRAVSQMESIRITRSVLRVNPKATGIEIAEAVALELNKNWPTDGTKQRNGNALRRWTVWLEPHLIDPSASSDAAALVAYATDRKIVKGRPASLRNSLIPQLEQYVAAGMTQKEIAAELNVSTATIGNWMRRMKASGETSSTDQALTNDHFKSAAKLFKRGLSSRQAAHQLQLPLMFVDELHFAWEKENLNEAFAKAVPLVRAGEKVGQEAAALCRRVAE